MADSLKFNIAIFKKKNIKTFLLTMFYAIDIGLENWATCLTNTGTTFIIDGRKLKSINQYWNKQKAHYQSIADKQGQKTHMLYASAKKCNNKTQDYIKMTASYIINYCIDNNI